jgi:hypothetical protein
MNSALYEGYLALLSEGRRKDAALMLGEFLRSFNSYDERELWSHTFLKNHAYGARVRHEVYAEVIFPVLLAGSKRKEAWSLYWLAGTSQNLYRARGLHEQIKFKGEIGLLKDAYEIDRNSPEVREALLTSLLNYFDHASHEWPAGILWGMDGATLDQCNEIMSAVTLARELDREFAYALSIDDFECKLKQYQQRLTSDPGGHS